MYDDVENIPHGRSTQKLSTPRLFELFPYKIRKKQKLMFDIFYF